MLRRAATLLSRHPAASRCGIPRHPPMASPFPSLRHAQAELGGALRVPHPGIGAGGERGYARMARRLPPARPDGYSTSNGEAEEPDARVVEEDDLEPRAGAKGEDSEGSEMEGFMLEYCSGSDTDGGDDEEEGAEETDR